VGETFAHAAASCLSLDLGETTKHKLDSFTSKQHLNFSANSGLKIIQTYFHGQVKPNDPLDFPPLTHETASAAAGTEQVSANAHKAQQQKQQQQQQQQQQQLQQQQQQALKKGEPANQWNCDLATQMKKMVIDKKPTMSDIVKAREVREEDHDHVNSSAHVMSDHSDESGRGPSPTPTTSSSSTNRREVGAKSWMDSSASTTASSCEEESAVGTLSTTSEGPPNGSAENYTTPHSPVWDPWSASGFSAQRRRESLSGASSSVDESALMLDDHEFEKQRKSSANQQPLFKNEPLKFEPLPTVNMSAGIWSAHTTMDAGSSGW